MEGYRTAVAVFPPLLQELLLAVSREDQRQVQEIRLRRSHPVGLTIRGQVRWLSVQGECCLSERSAVICRDEWITQTFDTACRHSVYAYQEQLCRGYITAQNGCRIGIAGSAVVKNGFITAFRDITSLCVRVAREHDGCAERLMPYICDERGIHSMLICSEPCGGKSSILKDLLFQLDRCGVGAAVVDERGELATTARRCGCDLLLYTPKATGIELAVRTLSPQVIVFDELGSEEEIRAVTAGLYSGVPTVASIHCRTPQELYKRPLLASALHDGAFEYLCFLRGREHPGEIGFVIKTEEWLRERDRNTVGRIDRHRYGCDRVAAVTSTGGGAYPFFTSGGTAGREYPLFGGAD